MVLVSSDSERRQWGGQPLVLAGPVEKAWGK